MWTKEEGVDDSTDSDEDPVATFVLPPAPPPAQAAAAAADGSFETLGTELDLSLPPHDPTALQAAAAKGDVRAQFELGESYFRGTKGVARSTPMANFISLSILVPRTRQ